MLAEKFFLVLETLISHANDHKPLIVISTAPHVAIKLPRRTQAPVQKLLTKGSPFL
jgi:hypothetical protein